LRREVRLSADRQPATFLERPRACRQVVVELEHQVGRAHPAVVAPARQVALVHLQRAARSVAAVAAAPGAVAVFAPTRSRR